MNCKPGDLAYLVASDFQENIGRIVEVTKQGWMEDGRWVWTVTSSAPLTGWILEPLSVGRSTMVNVFDDELRPISGVPVTDDVKDEVPA
ncbi:hypothetical protein [Burkholderia cenocepacia]|uniref:hypothetical protein n=1 Tax=Burkholderia cenocepacia TaxID=95486 RepID=UPI00158A9E54|nr:hypothetical protein [Burkholderia cenocepacia]